MNLTLLCIPVNIRFSDHQHQADQAGAGNSVWLGFMSDGNKFPSNPACNGKDIETAGFHGRPGLEGMGAVLAFENGTRGMGQTQGTLAGGKPHGQGEPHVKSSAFQFGDNFFMFEFGGNMLFAPMVPHEILNLGIQLE